MLPVLWCGAGDEGASARAASCFAEDATFWPTVSESTECG
jgi:hypothetical protein